MKKISVNKQLKKQKKKAVKKNLVDESLLKFKNREKDINKIEIVPYPGKEFYL